jgi:undecaprenyl pyrophosphate phosphatase UppP
MIDPITAFAVAQSAIKGVQAAIKMGKDIQGISADVMKFFEANMVTATLCAVVLSLIWALIHGLFVKEVDNTKIFEIIGPAFQTIIGGLIGWLSGLKVGSNKDEDLPCKRKD